MRKRLGVLGAHGLESQSFGINTIVNNLNSLGHSAAAEVLQRGGFFGPLAGREDLVQLVRDYLSNDFAWFFRAVRIMAEHDRLDVAGLDLPAEVLVGLQDSMTDPRLVEQFGRNLPQADIMLLNVSHFVPIEAPEEVDAALARIVKRVALADQRAEAAGQPGQQPPHGPAGSGIERPSAGSRRDGTRAGRGAEPASPTPGAHPAALPSPPR